MEVVPTKVTERTFAVVTLFGALFFFSFLVSSITSLMVQLGVLHRAATQKQRALELFLSKHRISAKLTVQVKQLIDDQRRFNVHCWKPFFVM